ncbi:PadR family transcriptional regulator [Microlunatus capsulatus]|uniref:DNA-binding PadR family transcriptional regulator n=1 Tax=Microlunatus capsulatus TaxID=99117 RepID=A0ABS4Z3N4_9ACTN|nr:PadR family transcriptional regulator [Microlunatus capsulatus]MBP2415317.1 DNA-binding PadR family transcriptional regulator [Microlunatus capsulatus]
MTVDDLREPTLLILAALATQPRHGYALIEAVAELSEGRVRLKAGSLYATLDRLAREGLVAESGSEVVAGRHRRYYALTGSGVEVLSAQTARLQALAAATAAAVREHRRTRSGEDRSNAVDVRWAGGPA